MSNSTTTPGELLTLGEFRDRLSKLVTSFVTRKLTLAVVALRKNTQMSAGQIAKALELKNDSAVERMIYLYDKQQKEAKGGK